ncbi:MAG: NADH-quinone oxidoreductase subunit J [Bryobacterales bacterium]|nr:NADH-quinone oxidoreductase subunit J [Bryobacterales bacterium]
MLDTVFFYLFTLLTLGGAILTVATRNAVHSALFLITSLLGVAGLYLLLHAEFLFAVQIIVYVGGIMVLFLFVIMLVNLDAAAAQRQFSRMWPVALGCVALVGLELFYFLGKGEPAFRIAAPPPVPEPTAGNTERIADVLFSQYLLPFEIASLLLLVAVIGSVVMAKKRI